MSPLVNDATGNDLTYRIIGAAMAVHNGLGPGHREQVYERALAAELLQRDISVELQVPVEVLYNGTAVALLILDLYVEQRIVVELKAFAHALAADDLA